MPSIEMIQKVKIQIEKFPTRHENYQNVVVFNYNLYFRFHGKFGGGQYEQKKDS